MRNRPFHVTMLEGNFTLGDCDFGVNCEISTLLLTLRLPAPGRRSLPVTYLLSRVFLHTLSLVPCGASV
jgi:hypothetical protein